MKNLVKKCLILAFLFFLLSSFLPSAECAVPRLINYQGKLTDTNGVPLTGSYAITFRIYDALSGGNMLWEETQQVVIDKGIFGVLLGSAVNLNLAFDIPYYLEIKVGSEVMSPRQQIAASAYAITADNGVPRGMIAMWSGSVANIPVGWALCDGTNGTPDLRDKFVKSIPNSTANPGATGGASAHNHSIAVDSHVLSIAEIPQHTHYYNTRNANGWGSGQFMQGSNEGGSYPYSTLDSSSVGGGGGHSHTASSANASSLPPYYELAFIMKL
ncbi:MAG: hypothetical protein AABY43_02045 [Candidatus Omnitrophota bacterium]|mgnify:CR=1 FL=1